MISALRRRGWLRLALNALIVIAFVCSLGVDIHVHAAHASHGHDAHSATVADAGATAFAKSESNDGPTDTRDAPTHATFGETSHCSLVLLAPELPVALSPQAISCPGGLTPQSRLMDRRWRLDKPPKALS